jgi:putative endonuclease
VADRRKALGIWGERLAADHLARAGYGIIQTNYRCPQGEIDIVAREGQTIVFVEVRTRRSLTQGTPLESITLAKQKKLIEVSQAYLQEHELEGADWRIDVVAVTALGDRPQIRLVRSAVAGDAP